MSTPPPRYTIAIPAFNGEAYLRATIDSALAQDFGDFEVIVSDDASSDKTEDICNDYIGKPRFRYYRHERNLGPARNYEFLLTQSSATYFKWLAHDDMCNPELLSAVDRIFSAESSIVGVAADVQIIDSEGRVERIDRLDGINPSVPWHQARKLFFDFPISNIFHAYYGIFRRDVLARQVFEKRILRPVFSDTYTNIECHFLASLATCGRIVAINEPLLRYRMHQQSMYHQEMKRLSRRDDIKRGIAIRMQLVATALGSNLPLSVRAQLALVPIFRFLRRLTPNLMARARS